MHAATIKKSTNQNTHNRHQYIIYQGSNDFPTAISITLPLAINSLNSLIVLFGFIYFFLLKCKVCFKTVEQAKSPMTFTQVAPMSHKVFTEI